MYKEKRKEASKICRRKKNEFLRGKIEQLVEHNNKKDIRSFYKETKDLIQGYQPRIMACKDKEERTLNETMDIKKR